MNVSSTGLGEAHHAIMNGELGSIGSFSASIADRKSKEGFAGGASSGRPAG